MPAHAQDGAPPPPPPVEKLGNNLFRVGNIRVDTARREFTVPGKVNSNVMVLEFVANARRGPKAYETAIELDTDAIVFNTACLLIGLDRSRSVQPTRHFDPREPVGDAVQVFVSWEENGKTRQIDAEQLLYDRGKNQAFSNSRWVYTGSTLLPNGRFLAEVEGSLIGFVHTPAPIIENVSSDAINRYGAIILNPELGLKPEMPITVTVRAVQKTE
jgi:hypothetical protein